MKRKKHGEHLISDLSVCEPASALGNRYTPGKWKLLPYEHEDFSGVMLGAIGSRDAAPVRLSLNLKGWHEVYVGIYPTFEAGAIRLRLSSDRAWRKFRVNVAYDFRKLMCVANEYFWTAADLTGESIHIAPLAVFGRDIDNYVAYFRLVPMSAAKVRALEKDRRGDSKRLYAMNDATSMLGHYSIGDADGLAEEIDLYRNSDFRGVCWELFKGDQTEFPVPGVPRRNIPRNVICPGRIYEEIRRMQAKMDRDGLDYLRVMRDLTRQAGLELHVSHRMGHASQVPYEEMIPTDFHQGKYDDYCHLADGAPVQRFSYAKRHVQDKMLRLYEAAAAYGVDGFHLIFIRGGPAVMYEDEMVECFRQTYGTRTDPRKLPLHDRRLLDVRGEIFAGYLRRLRTTVDAAAEKAGHQPPTLTVHGLTNAKACATFGLDLGAWAKQGLIDRIVASPWGDQYGENEGKWRYIDIDYYVDAVAGTKTELCAEIWDPPASLDCAEYYGERAELLYRNGIQNIYFWDNWARHAFADHYDVLSVLGHKRNLARRLEAAAKKSCQTRMRKVGGVEVAPDRFPPWQSG